MTSFRHFVCFFLLCSISLLSAQSTPIATTGLPAASALSRNLTQPAPKNQAALLDRYGKLPLAFEANQGQTNPQAKFLSRGSGFTLFLTGDEAIFSLRQPVRRSSPHLKVQGAEPLPQARLEPASLSTKGAVLRMKLVKANPAAKVTGEDQLAGKSNYFIGNDPKKWHSSVPTYGKVKYHAIYPGIDLAYYGNQRQLEYDFVVAPGADPHRIQWDVRGAKSVNCDQHGDLVLRMTEGEVRWRKPLVYQQKDGRRQEIAARYDIKDSSRVGFKVAAYDADRPLYIDPLVYSTYLGGSGEDAGIGIALDSSNNVYIVGYTASTNFPTSHPLQSTNGGGSYDVFVTKMNASGSALVYSTYLGGNGADFGNGIAVDGAGNAYIAGQTRSTNFPTVNPLQATYGGSHDAFVAKINPAGSALVYSTYLGGTGEDDGRGIAIDHAGNAYVIGNTFSTNFPVANAVQGTYGGGEDAFLSKISFDGSALVYSTYLGGSSFETSSGVAVDLSGNAYVVGCTGSSDFPTMNPLQPQNAGQGDVFITKVNSSGSALVYSTYLGGSGSDDGSAIAVDGAGNAYLTGIIESTNFPTVNAIQPAFGGGVFDGFVAEINSAGSALVFSTYLGGNGIDQGTGITLDSFGNIYLTGQTGSTNFPVLNALQPAFGGGDFDGFAAQINPSGSAFVYSTYLGGESTDASSGIAVDSSGSVYITGVTNSTNFPTLNPLQPAYGGGVDDAFVAKIAGQSPAVTLSVTRLIFPTQVVFTTSASKSVTLTNSGFAALTITSITATGAFSQTNTCGTTVAAGASCTISVSFSPKAKGALTGSVSITDNATGSPQKVMLTGTGTYVQLNPTSVNFGNQPVGTKSGGRKVTLSNKGSAAVAINSITLTGTNAADFAQTNTCGTSVASGASCSITVTFTPSARSKRTANVSFSDDGGGSPQTVALSGTGT